MHVNADDPEAAISSIRFALAYRQEFGHDVVVDLIGYRRFGHNEQDEAAYTQPLMVAQIAEQPTAREQYSARLVEEGVLTAAEAAAVFDETQAKLRAAHERLKASIAEPRVPKEITIPADTGGAVLTAVPADRLETLNEQLLQLPEGFEANAKLLGQLERRREALRSGGIDWGQAEALAFASLLTEGIPIRLSGQDTERGTFSHRHAVLHDQRTGETYAPIQNLPDAGASFEIYNSPLSEFACLGFEYGYAVAAPDSLVLWEAQFGDFVNGAQIVVDQFLVAGLSKWAQTARLTLLLPHGYEGNGPEHSSAKLERFLQLAAQENIRVANCTTAGQFFHLLRRQALDATARPLVVMTPKGLLRLKQAASTLRDLAEGRFEPVLDDPRVSDRAAIRRLVLCSGKVFYDIDGHEERAGASAVAVGRLEQLYPFPVEHDRAADGFVPAARRDRLGPGGAAEHGCVAASSATGWRRRLPTECRFATSAAPGAPARARATRPRTSSSRTGSPARHSARTQLRGATSRAWFPRPRRPTSSHRMLSATPTPLGSIRETASRHTHSPTGRRNRWTVSSVLMNRYSSGDVTELSPFPESAATRTRASGGRLFARDQRYAHAHPRRRRAGLEEAARGLPPLHRVEVVLALPGRGVHGHRRRRERPVERRLLLARRRQRRVGAEDPPRACLRHLSALICEGRLGELYPPPRPAQPGVDPQRRQRDGAQDLERETGDLEAPDRRELSIARPRSAAGGPACCAPASHGPRVQPVGLNPSPSGT